MSMFALLTGDMNEDPIFSTHTRAMQQMNRMMDSMFSDPFEDLMPRFPRFPPLMGPAMCIDDGRGRHPQRARAGDLVSYGFPNMNRMFQGMEAISTAPSCHSFSSSSVVTMTTGPDGQPKVYKASSSMCTAPGGVRETQKSVEDSETGVKKMAIGHHLGERSHVVEHEKNYYTGNEEERQEFINLDEEEADNFNREWRTRTHQRVGAIQYGGHTSRQGQAHAHSSSPGTQQPLAITAGPSHAQEHSKKRSHVGNDSRSSRSMKYSRPRYETKM